MYGRIEIAVLVKVITAVMPEIIGSTHCDNSVKDIGPAEIFVAGVECSMPGTACNYRDGAATGIENERNNFLDYIIIIFIMSFGFFFRRDVGIQPGFFVYGFYGKYPALAFI